jgi:hypothetical protein
MTLPPTTMPAEQRGERPERVLDLAMDGRVIQTPLSIFQ